jgi:hypothetical protein
MEMQPMKWIGTLSKKGKKQVYDVYMVTPAKDLWVSWFKTNNDL